MAKKRSRDQEAGEGPAPAQDTDKMDIDETGSDFEDFDKVDADFEFFNFKPDIDFKGVRSLLRQLFDVDNELIDASTISDLIVAQNTIGSAVKVDSEESDPYCFLTVFNLKEHKNNEEVASFVKYLSDKARSSEALGAVPAVLENNHVGVVLSERLINMPTEIVPPMYSMVVDEIAEAVKDKEPYDFSHYLIVSRVYREVDSVLDQQVQRMKKSKSSGSLFYFHPEDEALKTYAMAFGEYSFTGEAKSAADSKRAFQDAGIKTLGFMMLLEANKFPEAAKAVEKYVGSVQE